MSTFSPADRNAVVVGGGGDIGFAVMKQLKAEGAGKIWVLDFDTERGESAASEVGGEFLEIDVTSQESVAEVCTRVLRDTPEIDVLVYSVGTPENYGGTIFDVNLENMNRQVELNVWGALRVIQLLAPQMRKRNCGRIVNIVSIVGLQGMAFKLSGAMPYVVSKGGLASLTEVVAADFHAAKCDNVLCNGVAPCRVDGTWVQRVCATKPDPAEFKKQMAATQKLGMVTPVQVASTVMHLITGYHDSGQIIQIGGGWQAP